MQQTSGYPFILKEFLGSLDKKKKRVVNEKKKNIFKQIRIYSYIHHTCSERRTYSGESLPRLISLSTIQFVTKFIKFYNTSSYFVWPLLYAIAPLLALRKDLFAPNSFYMAFFCP